MGIETDSPELVRKIMPAKASPFRAEDWSEVVKRAAGVMTDNNLVPDGMENAFWVRVKRVQVA